MALVFSMPALTVSKSTGVIGEDVVATADKERSRCRNNLDGVDCQCYGRLAGYVRSERLNVGYGARTYDQTELARAQAKDSCRR